MPAGASRTVRWLLLLATASLLGGEAAVRAQSNVIAVTVITGAWIEGTGANRPVASFSDPGCAPGVSYSATITWGDGASSTAASGPGIFGSCSSGFTVAASHSYPEEGTFQLTVAVQGSDGYAGSGSAQNPVADAPLALTAVARIEPPGVAFSVSVATFSDGDVFGTPSDYTAGIDWGDGTNSAGTVQVGTGAGFVVLGSHTYSASGNYPVLVALRDVGGASASVTSTLLVGAAIVSGGDTVRPVEGQLFSGEVATFADTQCDASVAYGATLDWGDGATSIGVVSGSCAGGFSVQGSHTYAEGGSYTIKAAISGSDGAGGTAVGTAVVSDAPLTGSGTTISVSAGHAFTLPLGSFTDAGPSHGASDYTASVDWGDGTPLSAGAVSGGPGAGPYTVTGSHSYPTTGSRQITVTVTDAGGASTAFVTAVSAVSSLLTVVAGSITGAATVPAGLSGASFTDAPCSPAVDVYTVSIDWGDGGSATSQTVGPGSSCATEQPLSATHAYARAGRYTFTVTVSGSNGRSGTANGTAVIAGSPITPGAPATLTSVEGQPLSGIVASFADPVCDPSAIYNAAVDWGDGATSSGTVSGSCTGGFSVQGTHTYAEEGSYTVRSSVTGSNGSAGTLTATAQVGDAPLTSAGTTISLTQNSTVTLTLGTFTDAGPNHGPSDYTATVDWGDGTPHAVGSISGGHSGDPFTVSGTHSYATSGSKQVTVTVADVGGARTAFTTTANVSTQVITVVGGGFSALQGTTATLVGASFTDAGCSPAGDIYDVTLDWGDGTPATELTIGPGSSCATGQPIVAAHSYAKAGSYAVTVAVTSPTDGRTGTANGRATIGAITLASGTAPALTLSEGQPFSGALAGFTDANAVLPASGYAVSIDWGDGTSPSSGTVTQTATQMTISGGHLYTEAGNYTLAITVQTTDNRMLLIAGTAAVAEVPVVVSVLLANVTQGVSVSGAVASFVDPGHPDGFKRDPDAEFSATIDWGDGNSDGGTVSVVKGNTYHVKGSHVYARTGSAPISVTVTHNGTTASATGMVTIAAGSDLVAGQFDGVTATFTDSDPTATADDFTASIDWGDGTPPSDGDVEGPDDGLFSVFGSHTYDVSGDFTITTTIRKANGEVRTATLHIGVNVAARRPRPSQRTLRQPSNRQSAPRQSNSRSPSSQPQATPVLGLVPVTDEELTGTEGKEEEHILATFRDPVCGVFKMSVRIAWGDGGESRGSLQQPFWSDLCLFVVSGKHKYVDAGDYDLTVRVHAGNGRSDSVVLHYAVDDAALASWPATIFTASGSAPSQAELAYFHDDDAAAAVENYTIQVDWGDGSDASTATATPHRAFGACAHPCFVVTGRHVFAVAGSFAITVTIRDAGGARTVAAGQATVYPAPVVALLAAGSREKAVVFHAGTELLGNSQPSTAAAPRIPDRRRWATSTRRVRDDWRLPIAWLSRT